MIFELSHENITTALREYMDRRGIATGMDFTFQMKTSRKGSKTSRAIITTLDKATYQVVLEIVPEAVVEAPTPQLELPFEDDESEDIQAEEKEEVLAAAPSTPFKKLFA